jgi:hypothetical protein
MPSAIAPTMRMNVFELRFGKYGSEKFGHCEKDEVRS